MYNSNRILSIFLFIQIIIIQILNSYPDFIEKYYSNGIYKFLSSIFRYVFGWAPFSIGDIIYIFLIIFAIRFLIRIIKDKERNFKYLLFQTGATFSIIYFLFYFLWGLNYSRLPLTTSMNLEKNKYDLVELTSFSDKILLKLSKLQFDITKNDTLRVQVPYKKNEILLKSANGYHNLSQNFSQFEYRPTSIKKSLFSLPLTYMGFAGYFNPLSGEAQVDHLIPKVSLPMTCSHEIAHQLGIASESEANFIGFLAAIENDDQYFQYSAYLMAYRYTLYDIAKKDPQIFEEYLAKTPIGIKKNFKEIELFWNQYKNPIEPFFKWFYDYYLKVNQQKYGIQSYSKMVDLLLAYDKKYPI